MIIKPSVIFFILSTFLVLALASTKTNAQLALFDVEDDFICLEEEIIFNNQSVNAQSFEWDFCVDDVQGDAELSLISNSSQLGNIFGISAIEHLDTSYVFLISFIDNRIVKLTFDNPNNPSNFSTQAINIPNELLSSPSDLEIVNHNGQWVGFVSNFGNGNIIKLEFGNSLSNNNPNTQVMSSFGSFSQTSAINIVRHSDEFILFVANGIAQAQITQINLGNDLSNINPTTRILNTSGIASIRGFDIIETCQGYYFLVGGLNSNNTKLFKLDSQLENNLTDIQTFNFNQPANIRWVFEAGQYHGYVQLRNGDLMDLNFQNNIENTPTQRILASQGNSGNGIEFFYERGNLVGLGATNSGNTLNRIEFEGECSSNTLSSALVNPNNIRYNNTGNYTIALTAYDQSCNQQTFLETITIQNLVAPDITVTISQNRCLDSALEVSAITSNTEATINWDFGDGTTANQAEVNHTYQNTGEFIISTSASLPNGCQNNFSQIIPIYPRPQAALFNLPTGIICTNDELVFENITDTTNFRGALEFQWNFNNEGFSSQDTGVFEFNSTGNKNISLIAFIPGCTTEVNTQQLSVNFEGPEFQMNYTNNCQGQNVVFDVIHNGILDEFNWDFGDNINSSSQATTHSYQNQGNYLVELQVTDINGCQAKIDSLIEVDFGDMISLQLSDSALNVPILFSGTDLTPGDDSVNNWTWRFEDETINQQQFRKPFFELGNTNIQIEALTRQGCNYLLDTLINIVEPVSPFPFFDPNDTLICIGEDVLLNNQSVNAQSFEWDFCVDDVQGDAELSLISNSSQLGNIFGISAIEHLDTSYVFLISFIDNRIVKLTFDNPNNPSNFSTQAINIPNELLSSPSDLEIVNHNGQWVGFVSNFGNGNIIKLEFGNSLSNNNPNTQVMSSFGSFSQTSAINIVRHSDEFILFVANGIAQAQITQINLGNDLSNINPTTRILNTSGIASIRGFDIIETCQGYYFLVGGLNSNNTKLFKLDSQLENNLTDIQTFNFNQPANIRWVFEAGQYHGYVQLRNGDLMDLNFQNNIENTPTQRILASQGNSGNGIEFFYERGNLVGLGATNSGNTLNRIEFEGECSSNTLSSALVNPNNIRYNNTGNYTIALTAYDQSCNQQTFLETVSILPLQAPSLTLSPFSTDCITQETSFTLEDVDLANLKRIDWNFGDGTDTSFVFEAGDLKNTSIVHIYPEAITYDLLVSIGSSNGCSNSIQDTVAINFSPLVPSFTPSADQFCTDSPIRLENNTNTGGRNPLRIEYEWRVNNESYFDREPVIDFDEDGTYEISMVAKLDQECISDTIKQSIGIAPSSKAIFNTNSVCLGQDIMLLNTSEGPIQNTKWNFGDGIGSLIDVSSHRYQVPGSYQINLEIESPNGCISSADTLVTVYGIPTVEIQDNQICEGVEVLFSRESFPNEPSIIQHEWILNDTLTVFSTNPVFEISGSSNTLKLILTDENGCIDSSTVELNALGTPDVDVNTTNLCFGDEAIFTMQSSEELQSFFWTLNGQIIPDDPSPRTIFASPGMKTYSLNFTSALGCQKQFIDNVFISPAPNLTLPITPVCQNEFLELSIPDQFEGVSLTSIEWSIEDIKRGTGEKFNFKFSESGQFGLNVSASTPEGCNNTANYSVTVNESPDASIQLSQEFIVPPGTVNLETVPNDFEQLIWKVVDNVIEDESRSLTLQLDTMGEYNISLTKVNGFGCADSSVTTIRALEPISDLSLSTLNTPIIDNQMAIEFRLQNLGNLEVDRVILTTKTDQNEGVREEIQVDLTPNSSGNYSSGIRIPVINGEPGFVCIDVKPLTNTIAEVDTSNNKVCRTFGNEVKLMRPYPSPATDFVNVEIILENEEQYIIEISDFNGTSVFTTQLLQLRNGLNQVQIPISELSSGVYFVNIFSNSRSQILSNKFFKQ